MSSKSDQCDRQGVIYLLEEIGFDASILKSTRTTQRGIKPLDVDDPEVVANLKRQVLSNRRTK